jgi:tetratricopeptide (TPR) repeat protein
MGGIIAFRKRQYLLLLLPVAVPLFSFSVLNRNFVGLRHLLVIYPFLLFFAAMPFAFRYRFRPLVWALFLFQVVSTLGTAPHYLAYFNEAVGGPKKGDAYLLDSNYDWGQDFEAVNRRIDEAERLWKESPGPLPVLGVIAVKAMDFHGYPGTWPGHPWLRPFEPKENIGYTWRIYDLSLSDFEGVAQKDPAFRPYLGWALQEAGEEAEALRIFQEEGEARGEALVLSDQAQWTSAWEVCEKAREKDGSDPELNFLCALIQEEMGRSNRAEEYARNAVLFEAESAYPGGTPSFDPKDYEGQSDAVTLNNLGYLKWRRGDEEGGMLLFRRATEADPLFADPWGNLAAASAQFTHRALLEEYEGIGKPGQGGDPSRRGAFASAALRYQANYMKLTVSTRAWWTKRVHYRGHVAVYPKIFVLPLPSSPAALELLSKGDPLSLEDRENLGVCYLMGEDDIHALRAFRSVLHEQPDRARSHYHVGVIRFRNRMYRLARQSLEHTIELKPDYKEAKASLLYLDRYLER